MNVCESFVRRFILVGIIIDNLIFIILRFSLGSMFMWIAFGWVLRFMVFFLFFDIMFRFYFKRK